MSFKTRWNDLLASQTNATSSATSLGGDAARLYINNGDETAIAELFESAQESYTLAKDGKDKDMSTAIGNAWRTLSMACRSVLSRGGFSVSFDSLPESYKKGSGEFRILTKADAKAEKQVAEYEINAKREEKRVKAMEKQQAELSDRLRSLTAVDIAESIRDGLNLSGVSVIDLIVELLRHDGEAIRSVGSALSGWYSLAEQAEQAEQAKQAKQAKRQVAKQARQAATLAQAV